jgi:hypothetical protein
MNSFAVQAVRLQDIREAKECFNSTKRGYTMPAFTFEKISPPADRGPVPPVANKKQRGVIVQILDRFAEARVKRTLKEEKRLITRNRHRSPE